MQLDLARLEQPPFVQPLNLQFSIGAIRAKRHRVGLSRKYVMLSKRFLDTISTFRPRKSPHTEKGNFRPEYRAEPETENPSPVIRSAWAGKFGSFITEEVPRRSLPAPESSRHTSHPVANAKTWFSFGDVEQTPWKIDHFPVAFHLREECVGSRDAHVPFM